MKRIADNWPRIALLYLPLFIITVDAAVLMSDRLQTEPEKAIRLVRESTSRKENFTVQQYLYSTVYNRRSGDDPVEIEGWRATEPSDANGAITVEFSYTDASGKYTALWDVNLKDGKVIPRSEAARDLSWH